MSVEIYRDLSLGCPSIWRQIWR